MLSSLTCFALPLGVSSLTPPDLFDFSSHLPWASVSASHMSPLVPFTFGLATHFVLLSSLVFYFLRLEFRKETWEIGWLSDSQARRV